MISWGHVAPELLQPQFRSDIEALLAASPFAWTVIFGYRSLEEQQVLWEKYKAGGPRAAPPGKSAHNYGLAVDIVPDADPTKAGLQPDWNTSHESWQWLFEAVAAHPRLHSGRSYQDSDHVEKLGWKPTAT